MLKYFAKLSNRIFKNMLKCLFISPQLSMHIEQILWSLKFTMTGLTRSIPPPPSKWSIFFGKNYFQILFNECTKTAVHFNRIIALYYILFFSILLLFAVNFSSSSSEGVYHTIDLTIISYDERLVSVWNRLNYSLY